MAIGQGHDGMRPLPKKRQALNRMLQNIEDTGQWKVPSYQTGHEFLRRDCLIKNSMLFCVTNDMFYARMSRQYARDLSETAHYKNGSLEETKRPSTSSSLEESSASSSEESSASSSEESSLPHQSL